MIRYFFCALAMCTFHVSTTRAADAVGYREIELADPEGNRPLHATVWYPAVDSGTSTTVADDLIFYGVNVIENGAPSQKAPSALVLLSHGYGGSWRNLSWLAAALVQEGYVVAAPNHPGTTAFKRDPAERQKLWQRPRDLSRMIDALQAESFPVGTIDLQRIASIGHSLGGWTVTALAGGRFDTEQFLADCETHPNPFACGLAQDLGISADNKANIGNSMMDHRIAAFVTLDIGLARGFTPESLQSIRKPFLIIGAGTGSGGLPTQLESGYLGQHLPDDTSRLVEIADAMHFSFIQQCKPNAVELLTQDSPSDVVICKDGGTTSRASIHQQVADFIIKFLAAAIPSKPQRSG